VNEGERINVLLAEYMKIERAIWQTKVAELEAKVAELQAKLDAQPDEYADDYSGIVIPDDDEAQDAAT
jgi:hypothetical protein